MFQCNLQKRRSYVLLSHSNQWHSEAERHKWHGYCWTGHCSPLYMSHLEQGVARQFGKDAIHFDLIGGHEQNKKNNLNFKREIKAFSHIVSHLLYLSTHARQQWNRREKIYFWNRFLGTNINKCWYAAVIQLSTQVRCLITFTDLNTASTVTTS